VTLVTADMSRAFAFYESLGFLPCHGSAEALFSSFRVGAGFLNLVLRGATVDGSVGSVSHGAAVGPGTTASGWGRVIVHVSDVDGFHEHVLALGLRPHAPPRDAAWGERYFHLTDPDGHELSFARPLGIRAG
jgi:catechol 2,3-dioxygenase-like lactoylglutathione lyase family enzyme